MDLIAFVLLLVITAAVLMIVNYYRSLFSDGREEYHREELVQVKSFFSGQWQILTGDDIATAYLGLGAGLLLGLLFSYFGGIYGYHYESYFFHSALMPALWFLALPYLKEQFVIEGDERSFIARLITNDMPFFFAFASATIAQNTAAYFIYQKISFFWIIANNVIIAFMVWYRLYKKEKNESSGYANEAYDDDQGYDDIEEIEPPEEK